LDKAGALKKTRRSHFAVTDRGKELLAQYPDRIDNKVLKQFPEFADFQNPKSKIAGEGGENSVETDDLEAATPEERIEAAEEEINNNLRSDLLERIQEGSPTFFERVVVDLLVGMGYGGSRETTAKRIGKSGDEGIDGVVNEDPLGLDVIYLQAKRYAAGNNIGREKIQQFAGALVGQGANKGVFVTTSAFTQGAIEYAQKIPQRLILIDGDELTRLMVRYGVGVRTERQVEIRKLDLDYFGNGE
jgi:restriction system protein